MKISKEKAKSVMITFLVALVAKVGLDKAMEWAATEGDMAEKISSGVGLLGGIAAQFSSSELVNAAGIVGIGVGGHRLINAFITDDSGAPKTDAISMAVAKATLPENTALNGISYVDANGTYNPAQVMAAPEALVIA